MNPPQDFLRKHLRPIAEFPQKLFSTKEQEEYATFDIVQADFWSKIFQYKLWNIMRIHKSTSLSKSKLDWLLKIKTP